MDKATIALLVSVGSLLVAGLSLGWNIYRDIVLKPRVEVSFGKRVLHHSTLPKPVPKLNLSVTNLGPGPVKFSMIQLRNATVWNRLTRTTKWAVVMHDYTEPLSARLPATVEPGDRIELLLPWDEECCMSAPYTHIRISDFFGRVHWAPCKDVRATREQWLKDFADKAT
jgi:hypothetical protein